MKANYALVASLANTVLTNPLANRDAASDLTTLTSNVKIHTANINQTLITLSNATLSTTTNTTSTFSNSTSNGNITAEFNLIAVALNSLSEPLDTNNNNNNNDDKKRSLPLFDREEDTVACDATCQQAAYNDLGGLTAEIAYTMAACIQKNAVDLTSSSSVLITVAKALGDVTSDLEDSFAGIAGIVVQTLQAALGTDIGGALATFVSS